MPASDWLPGLAVCDGVQVVALEGTEMKTLLLLGTLTAAFVALPAKAGSLSVVSDGSTLAASAPEDASQLNTPAISGLTFSAVAVGGFGTFTPLPSGSPPGTEVVNIAPGDGESGYFLVDFTLPTGVTNVSIAGAANVDDIGRVFLNGNALTPSLGSSGEVSEYGDVTFSSSDASFFQAGTNELLISDDNSGGGPSGAAFYAVINFSSAVPEPTPIDLMLGGLAMFGLACFVRRASRSAPAA
jgi:hypothetical protein